MTLMPSECPRCNSEQRFVPKLRETEHGWQEEFIRCTVCRWEYVLAQTTPEIEVARKKLKGLNERREYEAARHGQPSSTLSIRCAEVHRELRQLEGDLAQEVRQVGEPAHPDAA